jgi:hypothetical protein
MWIKQKAKNRHGEDAINLVWHEPETAACAEPLAELAPNSTVPKLKTAKKGGKKQ